MKNHMLLEYRVNEAELLSKGRVSVDSHTGKLYADRHSAVADGVPDERIVEINGTIDSVIRISNAIKSDRRRKNKQARKSRKKNRTN